LSAKIKKQALQLLTEEPLSLKELSSKMELTDKRTYKVLKSLFEKGQVASFRDADKQRRYRIVTVDT
jgi:sugar-specific transcriptional regulator TrmB